jgi:hypothetical protein
MQAMLDFTLKNQNEYSIQLLNDTIIENIECFCIRTIIKDKTTIPGYNNDFTINSGYIETSYFYINKNNYYPQKMRLEISKTDDPKNISFTDHEFYDIRFNQKIEEDIFSVQQNSMKNYIIQNIEHI